MTELERIDFLAIPPELLVSSKLQWEIKKAIGKVIEDLDRHAKLFGKWFEAKSREISSVSKGEFAACYRYCI